MPIPGYRLAARLVNHLPLGHGKLARSVAGQREAIDRWIRWASTQRTDGPLVWVHAASVGEGLAIQSVIGRLNIAIPDVQIVHSFSSPSAANWTDTFGADFSDYLPPDEPKPIRTVLDSLRPGLALFSRADLWPEFLTQLADRAIPVAVAGGAVSPSSRRLRQPARSLFRQLHDSINWLGAVSRADAERWLELGVSPSAVTVTGDPRHDQILDRVPHLGPLDMLLGWRQTDNVMMAGSTHQEDEIVVLEAFSAVSRSGVSVRLIVVPHDPTPRRVDEVVALAHRFGIAAQRWPGATSPPESSCIVVTGTGLLADLYAVADLAYVGGGFGRGGLHSVAEPAAYSLPVIMGPNYRNAADATALVEQGGAAVLSRGHAAEQLGRTWLDWIQRGDARITAGLAARRTLQRGAAARTVEGLLPLITPNPH